ncbi:MAG: hypothetical protein KAS02_01980 [Candidatus Pacebacteria bacterium]|nr:hypothetical protein [Candidatus Paceibacterota bacterium]
MYEFLLVLVLPTVISWLILTAYWMFPIRYKNGREKRINPKFYISILLVTIVIATTNLFLIGKIKGNIRMTYQQQESITPHDKDKLEL